MGIIEYPGNLSWCKLTSYGKTFDSFVAQFDTAVKEDSESKYQEMLDKHRAYLDDKIRELTIKSLKQNIFNAKNAVWFIILNVILSAGTALLVNYLSDKL